LLLTLEGNQNLEMVSISPRLVSKISIISKVIIIKKKTRTMKSSDTLIQPQGLILNSKTFANVSLKFAKIKNKNEKFIS
jgi:hypothetical protein